MTTAVTSKTRTSKTRVCLAGRFLGFVSGGSSPRKFMMVQTAEGEIAVKLDKSLRLMLHDYLVTGDWIRFVGKQKRDADTQELRYKAQEVIKTQPPPSANAPLQAQPSDATRRKPQRILVCTKSDCRKRGSNALCQLLETTLAESGRSGQVTVKRTGCMDRCKSGPHLVFMPDKRRYSKVTTAMLPDLMAAHL